MSNGNHLTSSDCSDILPFRRHLIPKIALDVSSVLNAKGGNYYDSDGRHTRIGSY